MLEKRQLHYFLDRQFEKYNRFEFIETDPVQIPHLFTKKEDREIAGFLTATIAWGQRRTIIKNATHLMNLMDNAPYDFVLQAQPSDLITLQKFVHRTFNGNDLIFFIRSLSNIYSQHGGLEAAFTHGYLSDSSIFSALQNFRKLFLSIPYTSHVTRHLSDVTANSAAKRLNMFLRWMVRQDNAGIDFGLWKKIPASALMLPLDIHTGNVSRELGLLQRTQNDWKSVVEVTTALREFDPSDPIKYDYALFGTGAFNDLPI